MKLFKPALLFCLFNKIHCVIGTGNEILYAVVVSGIFGVSHAYVHIDAASDYVFVKSSAEVIYIFASGQNFKYNKLVAAVSCTVAFCFLAEVAY